MAKDIQNVDYGLEKIFAGAQDFLPLLGTDYVEFYVGNAKQRLVFNRMRTVAWKQVRKIQFLTYSHKIKFDWC